MQAHRRFAGFLLFVVALVLGAASGVMIAGPAGATNPFLICRNGQTITVPFGTVLLPGDVRGPCPVQNPTTTTVVPTLTTQNPTTVPAPPVTQNPTTVPTTSSTVLLSSPVVAEPTASTSTTVAPVVEEAVPVVRLGPPKATALPATGVDPTKTAALALFLVLAGIALVWLTSAWRTGRCQVRRGEGRGWR